MIYSLKSLFKKNKNLYKIFKLILLVIRKYFHQSKSIYDNLDKVNILKEIDLNYKNYEIFFGYYDKSPFCVNNNLVLYHKVSIYKPYNVVAEICLYNIKSNEHKVIGNTKSWNWQQGSMLQWMPLDNSKIIYNIWDECKKIYMSLEFDIIRNSTRKFKLPVYNLGKQTNKFLSLNFNRLDKYAHGYGYSLYDRRFNFDDKNDGIWELYTTDDCVEDLILSIHEIKRHEPKDCFNNKKHYINHAEYFNGDKEIIFIHRWFSENDTFKSRLLKYDIDNKKITTVLDNEHVSHFSWKSKYELLIFATNSCNERGYFLVNVLDLNQDSIFNKMPKEDGHPTFSPDLNFILTDTYPNFKRKQYLLLYDVFKSNLKIIKKLHSSIKFYDENRCDFHPRWSNDGKWIAIDNTDSGLRSIRLIKLFD